MTTYPDTDYGARDLIAAEAAPCIIKTLHSPTPQVWVATVRFSSEPEDDVIVCVTNIGQFEVCDRLTDVQRAAFDEWLVSARRR